MSKEIKGHLEHAKVLRERARKARDPHIRATWFILAQKHEQAARVLGWRG